MKKNLLLTSFILSLPFWWGLNISVEKLENFCYLKEMSNNSKLFTANLESKITDEKIFQLKLKREKIEKLKELNINAKSVLLIKVDKEGKEKVFYEKNSNELLPIASLTKLMTALVVFDLKETYDLLKPIKITKEAVFQEDSLKGGNYLKAGDELLIKDLIYSMLIESNNDAAFALTDLIGKEAFVDLMNFYAKDLELKNTYFFNPTGLEPDNLNGRELINVSTAQDLVKISRYIMENYPQIFEITTLKSYKILKPDGSFYHVVSQNTNKLLEEFPEKIIGGKTGKEKRAEECLLLIFKDPEEEGYFISVILGSTDRFSDMKKILEVLLTN